jgi:hypothetical protein
MPLLYTEQKFYSEQNGELRYQKYWDRTWLVKVPQGEYYSGNYLENMWKIVPRRYVGDIPPSDVLILGCGACCAIDSVLRLWPDTRVDGLDYDPVIIDIGKTIYGDFNGKKVNLIVADAKTFIARPNPARQSHSGGEHNESFGRADTQKQYDLVIVDIFYGNRPVALLREDEFLNNLKKLLRNNGTLIANLATSLGGIDEEIFQAWGKKFPEATEAKYHGNKLGVFIKKDIPEDYYDMHQSQPYAESLKQKVFMVIGKPREYYFIQRLPFKTCVVTAMHTDTPPDIDTIKKETGVKHGVIFWSPWKRSFAEKPWRKVMLPPIHPKGNGLAYVTAEYRDRWNQTARRDFKKFKDAGVEIRSVNKEQFLEALMASEQKNSIKSMFKFMIEKLSGAEVHYWVALKDGKIVSGLAVMNYDKTSVHLAAFTSEGEEGTYAGTGLIDYWYQYAIKKGIKYLNFGHIRQTGESKAWQGFSDFKKKFIDEEIVIRNQYFRFF